ncbi:MAG TPA: hypothetical protein VF395_12690 [Polyangiaceae bacterium]
MRSPSTFHGMSAFRVLGPSALGLALSLSALPAQAGDAAAKQSQDDLERARALFRQGLSLEAAGNWAAALSKFEDVGKVKLTPQVRFHTARCNEQLGRLNEALGEYRLAEYEAGQQGLPDLAAISQSRQALETRVPKVLIRRGAGAESARIELDGVALGESQIGQPFAVDPGPHTVVAKLGGDKQFQQSAVVKESETAEILLVAPADTGATPATGTPAGGAASASGADDAKVSNSSALPWIVGGVGVAGLAGAGIFYALRAGAKSDLDNGCRGSVCPESLHSTQDSGKTYSTLTMVSLGVGVVGVGVATYLFVKGDSGGAKSGAETARYLALPPVDVTSLPGGGGVTVRARF